MGDQHNLVKDAKESEILPEGFIEAAGRNGHIEKWAPQKLVLAHGAVVGFWIHCGGNSMLESTSKGVPMTCRPSTGDQQVNAWYVSDVWRVGLHLENELERGEVEKAVRRVMVEKQGEERRERIKKLKEEVELSIAEGGSSSNSLNNLVDLIKSI